MKVICKRCKKEVEEDELLKHLARVHNDKQSADLQAKMDLLNAVLDDDEEPIKFSDFRP